MDLAEVKQGAGAGAGAGAGNEAAVARTEALLGVHPVRVMDDVFNCAHDYLCDGLDCLERSLREALPQPNTEEQKRVLRESIRCTVDAIHNLLKRRLDRNLDKMELYALSNVLCVPDGLDLNPEPPLEKQNEAEELSTLQLAEAEQDRRRVALEAKIRIAGAMNAKLQKELSMMDGSKASGSAMQQATTSQTQLLVEMQDKIDGVSTSATAYLKRSCYLQNACKTMKEDDLAPASVRDVTNLTANQIPLKKMQTFSESCS